MLRLGIDTSNYTTSVALFDGEMIVQAKRPLPVKPGELGLRQSDALFHHTVQLPALLEELLAGAGKPAAVGVSDRPRAVEGSYMPCFCAGVCAARAVVAALGVPLRQCSHQQGHLAAALFSAARLDLLEREFLAFHISGGTTECLHVEPGLRARRIGGSLDLKAGQLVDRVGVLLGFSFPAGAALDALALEGALPRKVVPAVHGMDCHLSGIENQCRQLFDQGVPSADIARYCLENVAAAIELICARACESYGGLPLVFTGGVCCSEVLRRRIGTRFPQALFAAPEFSADNAAGAAILAGRGL